MRAPCTYLARTLRALGAHLARTSRAPCAHLACTLRAPCAHLAGTLRAPCAHLPVATGSAACGRRQTQNPEKLILGHAGVPPLLCARRKADPRACRPHGRVRSEKDPPACNPKSAENANSKPKQGSQRKEYNAKGGEEAQGCRCTKTDSHPHPPKKPDKMGHDPKVITGTRLCQVRLRHVGLLARTGLLISLLISWSLTRAAVGH